MPGKVPPPMAPPLTPQQAAEIKRRQFWEFHKDLRDFHGFPMPELDPDGNPPPSGDL